MRSGHSIVSVPGKSVWQRTVKMLQLSRMAIKSASDIRRYDFV